MRGGAVWRWSHRWVDRRSCTRASCMMCTLGESVEGRRASLFDHGNMFGNPFKTDDMSAEESVTRFEEYARNRYVDDERFQCAVRDLRGRVLACWCRGTPCHADVLAGMSTWTFMREPREYPYVDILGMTITGPDEGVAVAYSEGRAQWPSPAFGTP